MIHHYTIGYKVEGNDIDHRFHTYAEDFHQAVQDLYDHVPDVLFGTVIARLKAPSGARRSTHDYRQDRCPAA